MRRSLKILFVAIAGLPLAAVGYGRSFESVKAETWQGGWVASAETRPDEYGAFRGHFNLPVGGTVRIEVVGAHWFQAQLDGRFLTEGPARFPEGHTEFEVLEVPLEAGPHLLTAVVHNQGVVTRTLHAERIPPFFLCRVSLGGVPIQVDFRAEKLRGYRASGNRVSGQFAWMEWVDTRDTPRDWESAAFDDSGWKVPEVSQAALWPMAPLGIGHVRNAVVRPKEIGRGSLAGPFDGAEPVTWKLEGDLPWYRRDLKPAGSASGVWRRYDLGQVRLGVPRFDLDLPAGAVVEFAYAESLSQKPIVDGYLHTVVASFEHDNGPRVAPYIPLSASISRNLDHYVARGGVQTFMPITPKGGRFLEVHIQAPPAKVRFLRQEFVERSYFGEAVGRFECDDKLLNQVWGLGIRTVRACAEDAIIDNPTRERGQWTGDGMVAMPTAAAGFNDLRLFRRGIEQAAYSANADGLVAGLHPGGEAHLSTYAAQWVTGAMNYYEATGDRELLERMYPAAVRNLDIFAKKLTPEGIELMGWAFVDWGFPDELGGLALSLHTLEASRSMEEWGKLLGKDRAAARELATKLREILVKRVRDTDWDALGYHCTVLALRSGLVEPSREKEAIAYVKRHILSCFPNNPDAPRLSDPGIKNPQIITPYFAYFAFPVLIEHGEMDFVLDQYRKCWGWGILHGLTTQAEVFDLNWSHCHAWGCSPTAQLSKYGLGLSPRLGQFELSLIPGSLRSAKGAVPFPNGSGAVQVSWRRVSPDVIRYRVDSPRPIEVALGPLGIWKVNGKAEIELNIRPGGRATAVAKPDPSVSR